MVESAEKKEDDQIKSRVTALLKAKDYDALDLLARQYRESKEIHPNGLWKLSAFYIGFEPAKEEPEALWQERSAALTTWMKERPKSVTASVAYARFLTGYAWKARGSGYADTVKEQGWKLFAERLSEAAKVLSRVEGLEEQCPYRWMVLLQVALGLNAEKPVFEQLLGRALQSAPGYTGYYWRQAIYLLPRWFGNEGEWEAALTKAADKIGGEEGDILYARVVWQVQEYGVATQNLFTECKISPVRVDKGFAAIQKEFPDALSVRSKRAYFACLAQNQKLARELFTAIDGKVDTEVCRTEDRFRHFANWACGQIQLGRSH